MSHSANWAIARLKATGINMASVADAATFTGLPARIRVRKVTVVNASTTPILAQLSVRDASGGGGNAFVAAATITALTGANKAIDSAIAISDVVITGALYIRCAVANAAGLTVDVHIEYEDLSV